MNTSHAKERIKETRELLTQLLGIVDANPVTIKLTEALEELTKYERKVQEPPRIRRVN